MTNRYWAMVFPNVISAGTNTLSYKNWDPEYHHAGALVSKILKYGAYVLQHAGHAYQGNLLPPPMKGIWQNAHWRTIRSCSSSATLSRRAITGRSTNVTLATSPTYSQQCLKYCQADQGGGLCVRQQYQSHHRVQGNRPRSSHLGADTGLR